MQCWRAVLLVRTDGVDAAGARASLVTRRSGAWHTYPTGVPHDLARECAPLPVPGVCSRVASRHESSGSSELSVGDRVLVGGCG